MFDYQFFIEVLVGGLLSGVMYSLVAIGFVLIYKTSGVLNFAQGAMLLFAALTDGVVLFKAKTDRVHQVVTARAYRVGGMSRHSLPVVEQLRFVEGRQVGVHVGRRRGNLLA